MKTVSVMPAAEGWVVRSDAMDNELYFRTGAEAERAARRIAEAAARAGEPAELTILLRDGGKAARFICPPLLPDSPPRVTAADFRPGLEAA